MSEAKSDTIDLIENEVEAFRDYIIYEEEAVLSIYTIARERLLELGCPLDAMSARKEGVK